MKFEILKKFFIKPHKPIDKVCLLWYNIIVQADGRTLKKYRRNSDMQNYFERLIRANFRFGRMRRCRS